MPARCLVVEECLELAAGVALAGDHGLIGAPGESQGNFQWVSSGKGSSDRPYLARRRTNVELSVDRQGRGRRSVGTAGTSLGCMSSKVVSGETVLVLVRSNPMARWGRARKPASEKLLTHRVGCDLDEFQRAIDSSGRSMQARRWSRYHTVILPRESASASRTTDTF